MTLKVWQRMITTPQCSADTPPAPRWDGDVPWCTVACPHMGEEDPDEVCGLTGNEAESVCIPAVEAMARLLNEDEP